MINQLIDLTEIIAQLNEKITNKNFDFTDIELELIKVDKDIIAKIYNLLENDYTAWKNLSENMLENITEILMSSKLSNQFIINNCKYLIDNGTLTFDLEEENYDKEINEIVNNYLKERLSDVNYQLNVFVITQPLLKNLINENRWDLISKLRFVYGIDKEIIQILKEHYSETKETIPPAFYADLDQIDIPIELLDFNALLSVLSKRNIDDQTFKLMMQKLNDYEGTLITEDCIRIFDKLTEDQKKIFGDNLLSRNCFDEIIKYLDITNENYEFYANKFIEALNGSQEFEERNLNIKFNKNYQMLLSDHKVVTALLNNKKILIASFSPLFENYISEVINIIRSDREYFKKIKISDFDIEKYPAIILELIKIGNKSAINFDFNNSEVKEYIKNLILTGTIDIIPNYLMNDDEFINKIILTGHIDLLFLRENTIKRNDPYVYNEESISYIINRAKHDIKFAGDFLRYFILSIIKCEQLLDFYLQSNEYFMQIILDKLNHLEENTAVYTHNMFILIKPFLITKYNLNVEHLIKFEEHFGPMLIRYISNANIISIINMNDADFEKILAIFPKLEFNMVDVEKIYDALKQFEFTKTHSGDIEIFAELNHMLNDNNPKYLELLEKLTTTMNTEYKFFKKFELVYPNFINDIKLDTKAFLLNIVNYIQNGTITEKNYYLDMLHFITDHYIATQREKYREEYNMTKELSLPYDLDEKDKIKQFIKYCTLVVQKDLIIMEMVDKGIAEDLAEDCILYYTEEKRNFSDDRLKLIKQNIKLMLEVANKFLNVTGMSPYMVKLFDSEEKIKRKYFVETNNCNIFSILMELRLDVLKDTILKDENTNVLQTLLTYIYKYKLHLLPNYFKNLMASENIDISLEVADVASFISYYGQIYDSERKRLDSLGKTEDINLGMIAIMKYAEAYSATSSVYSQILGPEDVKLLKSNPKPNSAIYRTNGDTRLKEAVLWTFKNFMRKEVTIPTFNEEIEFMSNDTTKKMRAIVGNFTHPSNLTLGERTGACMRIGGLGESLFNFCLEDKNGFHIRFEDPINAEFISRVSGFRNGNTVFLNELRFSCNPEKYSNKDVVKVCTLVAEMLIDRSKNSSCPIENVVLHNDYATLDLGLEEIGLDIDNNKEGLRKFYSDITNKGIILASTGVPFTKVNFDKNNVPIYETAREIPYINMDNNKLRAIINRVHTIKSSLSGFNYEYVEPLVFESGLAYGMANQDWYIYIDNYGNVFEEVIDIDSRALNELIEARAIIEEYKRANLEADTPKIN